eukprot:Skav210578  [mRNA]  locus=scaffold3272:77289:77798:+ [translate_table: standard]
MLSRTCRMLLALALTSSRAEDTGTGHLRGTSKEDVRGLEIPDVSGLPDIAGPYNEVPSDADAENFTSTMQDWSSNAPNVTQGSMGSLMALADWQEDQLCKTWRTSFVCDGLTRIHCCKLDDGYAKCGSTANSTICAAQQEPESESHQEKALWILAISVVAVGIFTLLKA